MSELHLVVCVNKRRGLNKKSCAGSGSRELIPLMRTLINAAGLDCPVVEQVCLGRCMQGIAMRIAPGGPFFTEVTEDDLVSIVGQIDQFQAQQKSYV